MLTIILLNKLMTFPNVLAILYFKKYICVSNIILFCKYVTFMSGGAGTVKRFLTAQKIVL